MSANVHRARNLLFVAMLCWLAAGHAQSMPDAAVQMSNQTSSVATQALPDAMPLKLTSDIEVGALHDAVSNHYGDWNGAFVRLVTPLDSSDTLNVEVVDSREFHDAGTLLTVGDTHTFTDRTYGQLSLATSTEGFYLPTARVDAALYEKWLEQLQLVTSVGVSAINSRDGHSDRALTLGAAYHYADIPLVAEIGARLNQSSPGSVNANSAFVAATYGSAGDRYLSLRYGFGREAYQLIGNGQILADFASTDLLLTWRQWVTRSQGFQLRLEAYSNPYYRRTGLEASWFLDF